MLTTCPNCGCDLDYEYCLGEMFYDDCTCGYSPIDTVDQSNDRKDANAWERERERRYFASRELG